MVGCGAETSLNGRTIGKRFFVRIYILLIVCREILGEYTIVPTAIESAHTERQGEEGWGQRDHMIEIKDKCIDE